MPDKVILEIFINGQRNKTTLKGGVNGLYVTGNSAGNDVEGCGEMVEMQDEKRFKYAVSGARAG